MELNSYQDKVIADLARYLALLADGRGLRAAYRALWSERGVNMPDYQDTVHEVPHVCVKVPTAGGKTFIAVNALQTIYQGLNEFNPDMVRFVVWLVPSLPILQQTLRAFNDPLHPYRQKLNSHFKGRVEIFDKQRLLSGAGLSPDGVREALHVVVLSYDSLRARNKEDRKIFQENGQLAAFEGAYELEPLENVDPSALINVIRALKPVVVVDESHNVTSDLSVDMLKNLNPSFILDLTATPRDNANIISFVDAMALKKHHMVKLPVIVYNHPDKTAVVASAIDLQKRLEQEAMAEEKEGGAYIRPIVLFQAQPKVGEDATTFGHIKEKLIAAGIPKEHIRIKTANIDELKNENLMNRDCPVRFIVTVNALKEGWDCPFAYVLASLADKSSAVDVEQILGRVLRQPYVRRHTREPLNLSYVMTASGKFLDTLSNIVKGLNRAGFSARDYRDMTPPNVEEEGATAEQLSLTPSPSPARGGGEPRPLLILGGGAGMAEEIEPERIAAGEPVATATEAIIAQAIEESRSFSEKAAALPVDALPSEVENRMNKYAVKPAYADDAQDLVLPQFFIEVEGGWFSDANNRLPLEKENLLAGFQLGRCDTLINFEDTGENIYQVDLEQSGVEDYTPVFKKVDLKVREKIANYLRTLPDEAKVRELSGRLSKLVGNMYPIPDKEISDYVRRVVGGFSADQIADCVEREHLYLLKIKRKIQELAGAYAKGVFGDWLQTGRIQVRPNYRLPETINPTQSISGITKSLYAQEAALNGFEARLINEIANLPNVTWWHKNIEKRGFAINGYINHYPDFLLRLESGKLLVVESKGDDRDNSDSSNKLRLGKEWAAKAGDTFRYLMVFDNNRVDGAYTLSDVLGLIRQM